MTTVDVVMVVTCADDTAFLTSHFMAFAASRLLQTQCDYFHKWNIVAQHTEIQSQYIYIKESDLSFYA